MSTLLIRAGERSFSSRKVCGRFGCYMYRNIINGTAVTTELMFMSQYTACSVSWVIGSGTTSLLQENCPIMTSKMSRLQITPNNEVYLSIDNSCAHASGSSRQKAKTDAHRIRAPLVFWRKMGRVAGSATCPAARLGIKVFARLM